ncbi:MAG: Gfo/Idh/MocA family oxidoreductase [Planctomycetota bacterium]|nr:Gfo/Idh/MocA family oxidoreductase [Planctomycetota bacterium]
MTPLRWAIIGFGRFGRAHAQVLQSLPGIELVGVSSRQAGPLAERAATLGIERTEIDYRQLLDDDQVDVISIVTHWKEHHQVAMAALAAGKHVLLEKPMAADTGQCLEILDAAEAAPGQFMVGHICRFDPRYSLAREAIQRGEIGRIVSMHARRNLPVAPGNIRLDKISPLMGDGIHDADMMMWFTGQTPGRVFARNVKVHDYDYPDLGWAMLEFPDRDGQAGAIGVVETIWCLPENVPTVIDAGMQIVGSEGMITIDCSQTGLLVNTTEQLKQVDTLFWPQQHGRSVGILKEEISYFADCLRAGTPAGVVTAAEAARAVAVMEAAEQSAISRQPLEIELPARILAGLDRIGQDDPSR